MKIEWWHYGLWVIAAGLLGFIQTYILTGKLRIARRVFLIFYIPITVVFIGAYMYWTSFAPVTEVTRNLPLGILFAALGGAFLVKNVLSQPSSQRPHGVHLAVDVVWVGAIYGILDVLLLSNQWC